MRSTYNHGIDVERMQAFADAVIAIAITLLALDMKIPEGVPSSELGHALKEALPTVGGYLLSFVVIGVLWISHHRLFGMVAELDRWLLRLDLALLAVIAALPFPTKLISGYQGSAVATSVYAGSIALCALLIAAMSVHLLRQPALCRPHVSRDRVLLSIRQAAAVAVVFATSVPMTLISPGTAAYWWILSVPLRYFIARQARSADSVDRAGTDQPDLA
ncbi:TMEM175 family protein [Actinacidiphila soli]|uniref:TMEM175 family protein n=1 Tax=Actinacidiphila soli TaxID=2487275 RepID=UPI000FCC9ACF|nr:TMEM175 family protein [Actinacidiphila soli]